MSSPSKYHDELEKYIVTELESLGYKIIKFTYHEFKNNSEIEQILKNCATLECMFIRTLPDILAIKGNKSVFIEVKSKSPEYKNLALELFPLMVDYYLENILGFKIIYVYGYKNKQGKFECYCSTPKKIVKLVKRVIITDKFKKINGMLEKFYTNILNPNKDNKDNKDNNIVPESKTIIQQRTTPLENVGSGDPFVIIPKDNLKKFKALFKKKNNHET
jgi:Holliday junction resolvase-like predicted endonuclease